MFDHVGVFNPGKILSHPPREPTSHALDGILRVGSDLEWEVRIRAVFQSSNHGLIRSVQTLGVNEKKLTNSSPLLFVCRSPGTLSLMLLSSASPPYP